MTTPNENKLIVKSDNLSFNEQSQQTLIDKGDK